MSGDEVDVNRGFLKLCEAFFQENKCLNVPIGSHLFFLSDFLHRILAVSQWSWKGALEGLDSAFEEEKNTTWAYSSFDSLKMGQLSRMGEYT